MITIASAINKELDRYLHARRRDEKRRKPKKQKAKPMPEDLKSDEVQVIDEQPGFWQRWFGSGKVEEEIISEDLSAEEMERLQAMQENLKRIEEAEAEHPEAAEELEEVRESLMQRFFSYFRLFQRQHQLERREDELDEMEERMPQVDEDVKVVLRITHKWLERLGKKEKGAFKKSKDFQGYKEILERYGLVKK